MKARSRLLPPGRPSTTVSFPSDAMQDIPEEEMPAVAEAAHAVAQEAQAAGVWVFAGGMRGRAAASALRRRSRR
jgi:hypothetical protein